jgi:hypothetical protein
MLLNLNLNRSTRVPYSVHSAFFRVYVSRAFFQ